MDRTCVPAKTCLKYSNENCFTAKVRQLLQAKDEVLSSDKGIRADQRNNTEKPKTKLAHLPGLNSLTTPPTIPN